MKYLSFSFLGALLLFSCEESVPHTFPIIGVPQITESGDTIPHQIGGFSFIDQNGAPVTQATVEGKIYIADFFFTRCPDICPMMSKNLLKVEEAFGTQNDFLILSHSLDPLFDTSEELSRYKRDLGARSNNWYFLTTPDEDYVYEVMMDDYLLSGSATGALNGGIFHTGKLVLVDQNHHIRGYYEGTDPLDVDRLIEDIPLLMAEMKQKGTE